MRSGRSAGTPLRPYQSIKGEQDVASSVRRATLAFLLLFATASLSGCLSGGELVGKPVPAFEFVASDGTYVNASTHLGTFVILDMMATWCGPCKLEVAHLREVQDALGDRVVIYSVSVEPRDTMDGLEAFGVQHGARWPYALDRDLDMWRAMDGEIIPKLVVIDPQGVVVLERQGEVLPSAIVRVIDPSLAPAPWLPFATALAGLALGFLAALNPFRRVHRDGEGGGPTLGALGTLAALGMLAWSFSGLVSTRATLGGLFVGLLTLGSAAYWFRARRKTPDAAAAPPTAWQRYGDRSYELLPHFAAALVLALTTIGALAFFAPLLGFLVGATGGLLSRPRLTQQAQEGLGLAGLVLAGAGLVAFGARYFTA